MSNEHQQKRWINSNVLYCLRAPSPEGETCLWERRRKGLHASLSNTDSPVFSLSSVSSLRMTLPCPSSKTLLSKPACVCSFLAPLVLFSLLLPASSVPLNYNTLRTELFKASWQSWHRLDCDMSCGHPSEWADHHRFWGLNKRMLSHCLSYWCGCGAHWVDPGPNLARFLGLLTFHQSQDSPLSWIVQLWVSLDHNYPPSPTLQTFLSGTMGPTFTCLGFVRSLFSAHVLVILITGHYFLTFWLRPRVIQAILIWRKPHFLLWILVFCNSSLSKHTCCVLCSQPSCIFNDLQGDEFSPSFFFFFIINLMT